MGLRVEKLGFASGMGNSMHDISLQVDEGEFIVIETRVLAVGTSLLMAIGGLSSTIGGDSYLSGEKLNNLASLDKSLALRSKIAFVYREGGLITLLNVAENIALPLGYHKNLNRKEQSERIEPVARSLGIEKLFLHMVDTLDENQQRLVDLARALVLQPKLLLIDAILEGMPVQMQQMVMQVIDEQRQKYKMSVAMTVRSAVICPSCDRVYRVMNDELVEVDKVNNE